jgi:hypothetical protein
MPYMYQSRAALSIICPGSFVPTPLLTTWAFKKVGYKFHQELKEDMIPPPIGLSVNV